MKVLLNILGKEADFDFTSGGTYFIGKLHMTHYKLPYNFYHQLLVWTLIF